MAERRTSVRLAVVGGNEVRAELMAIGADGQRSLEGIGRGAQSAGAGLRLLDGNAAAARQQIAHLRGQTGNLAAQFQDIGVQLAGGQSPFLIALQQGGQISQVLGPAGARGAVAALAGAFASLVSPVSLATIGIIAAGGAAFQYFSTLGDGEKSAEELQKQADQIGQVARKWGDAVPALQAYVAELERAKTTEGLKESGEVLRAEAYESAREQVEGMANALVVLRGDLELLAGPEQVATISELQSAFDELQSKVEDNSATSEDAERVVDALNRVMGLGAPTAEEFAASVGVLAGALGTAADEAARAQSQINAALNEMRKFREADALSMQNLERSERTAEQIVAEQERRNALTREQLRLEDETARIQERVREAGGVITPARRSGWRGRRSPPRSGAPRRRGQRPGPPAVAVEAGTRSCARRTG